ncbi:RnfABCDGE type electron transport complex subunit B [Bergeriella denitrificans]|uniref:Ferredoxin n=1 Tax=Bergeriella denitrificans TaxID=494 RepID=A0A378UEW7_BERDE|nr:RnfABCDGE type electron transport complex subunit B [Bergeriella denitrificans]STZ75730.1 ferredoxin [Bergeriella denitrificans]
MTDTALRLNRLLPQTQCRECGYDGCLPYAEALASGRAEINLCAPGGETVMLDIAGLLGKPARAPAKVQAKALAWIDEAVCIGCTACIRACPVDAIMGAHKLMHTVIRDECTGCGLCVTPCPVDCIHMQPVEADYLPQARSLSTQAEPRFAASAHALARYHRHQTRQARDAAERKALLAEREAATKAKLQAAAPATEAAAKPAFNPMDLIAKAMAKAQTRQDNLVTAANYDDFKSRQIEEAKQRALYRRAQRDMKYGNEAEKAAALAYLRQYKAEQEALKAAAEKGKTPD